jgi:uncharacterized protein (DUF3820 family)
MTADLGKALHAFQKDAPPIHLDATNPHFNSKFASLAGVVSAIRPALNKHGLVYTQFPTNIDGQPALETMLIHAESGQDIAAVTPLVLAKNDPQGYGSALTYARRYALLSILGLVGDEDDDANSATPHNGDVHGLQESRADNVAPHTMVVGFGKHKGKQVHEVPRDYWEWWLGQDGKKDEVLRAAVELHLGLTDTHAVGAPNPDDDIPFAASEF